VALDGALGALLGLATNAKGPAAARRSGIRSSSVKVVAGWICAVDVCVAPSGL
jgi:hypothetical protein